MDILKILEESADSLCAEDFSFFETELATGGYPDDYIQQCLQKINQLKNWKKPAEKQEDIRKAKKSNGVMMDLQDLAPSGNNPAFENLSPDELIFQKICDIREDRAYKTEFKKYIKTNDSITSDFVDKHYAFFPLWEMNAIISVKQMGEDFLEKYFGALEHDKIARYQCFSEAFFMKHFSQMDANVVLLHGKNEWRKKENRSKQLSIFLRIKGVQI